MKYAFQILVGRSHGIRKIEKPGRIIIIIIIIIIICTKVNKVVWMLHGLKYNKIWTNGGILRWPIKCFVFHQIIFG